MIQQRALIEILKGLEENPINLPIITVETNGSISPLEEFYYYVDFWSVSPKLSTSACFDGTDIPKELQEHHNKTRINIKKSTFRRAVFPAYLVFIISPPSRVSIPQPSMQNVLYIKNCLIIRHDLHNAFNNLLYKIRCDILAVCRKLSSKE